jgi:hypothetical protein
MSIKNIYYGVVYKEQIHRHLTQMGLTSEEADQFLHPNIAKNRDQLKLKFEGTEKQWEILCDASKTSVNFSHAVSNFFRS